MEKGCTYINYHLLVLIHNNSKNKDTTLEIVLLLPYTTKAIISKMLTYPMRISVCLISIWFPHHPVLMNLNLFSIHIRIKGWSYETSYYDDQS